MPGPSYMQQALGTGGTSYGRAPGTIATDTRNPAPQTPGVDQAWSRVFGPATPAALLEQRQASGGVMPSFAPPQQQGVDSGVSATPQTAGIVNGMSPGALNGNADNGFSQVQQAGGLSNNQQGGPPASPMQQALAGAPKPKLPQPPVPMPVPVPPPPAPPTGAPLPPVPVPDTGKVGQAIETRGTVSPAGTQLDEAAAAGQVVGEQRAAAAEAPGAEGGGQTWNVTLPGNGQTYQVNAPKPSNWAQMTGKQKQEWVEAHDILRGGAPPAGGGQPTDPTQPPPAGGDPGAAPVDPVTGQPVGQPPAGTDPGTGDPGDLDYKAGTAIGNDFWSRDSDSITGVFEDWTGGLGKWWDKGVYQGLGLADNRIKNLHKLPHPSEAQHYSEFITVTDPFASDEFDYLFNPQSNQRIDEKGIRDLLALGVEYAQMGDFYRGDPGMQRQYDAAMSKLFTVREALRQYGINYNPAPVNDGSTGGGPGDIHGGPGDVGDRDPYDVNTSVDVYPARWGKDTPIGALLNIGSNDLSGEQRLAIVEFLTQLGLTEEGLIRNQQAINEAVNLRDLNQQDPLVQQFLARSQQDIPTANWDLIRNKAVADNDKLSNQIVQNLSTGAARRGLDAGAVQGIQSQFLGQQANALSSQLGDLDIAKSEEAQRLFQQKLGNLQAGAGVSTGLRNMSSQQIQQLLMGQAPVVDNPISGVANVGADLHATQIALDQLEEAGKSNWTDYLAAFGSVMKGAGGFMTGIGAL